MFPVHVLVACKIIGHKAKVWIIVAGSGSRAKSLAIEPWRFGNKKKKKTTRGGKWLLVNTYECGQFDEVTRGRQSLMGQHYPMILEKFAITFPSHRSQ